MIKDEIEFKCKKWLNYIINFYPIYSSYYLQLSIPHKCVDNCENHYYANESEKLVKYLYN